MKGTIKYWWAARWLNHNRRTFALSIMARIGDSGFRTHTRGYQLILNCEHIERQLKRYLSVLEGKP